MRYLIDAPEKRTVDKTRYFAIPTRDGRVEILSVKGRLKVVTSKLQIKGSKHLLTQKSYEGGEVVKIIRTDSLYRAARLWIVEPTQLTLAQKNAAIAYGTGKL